MSELQTPGRYEAAETVVRFFRHLDDRDYPGLTGLLAEDGGWRRGGKLLQGRDEVMQAVMARPANLHVHHILTNLLTEPAPDGELAVIGYLMVIRHDAEQPLSGPAPLDGIASARTVRARLRATPKGWRIVHLQQDPLTFEQRT